MENTARNGKIVAPFLLIIGLFIFYSAYKELNAKQALFETGKHTQAVVVEIKNFKLHSRDQSKSYLLVIEWKDLKETITVETILRTDKSREYKVGQELEVLYDVLSPKESFYVIESSKELKLTISDYWELVFGLFFIVMSFISYKYGIRPIGAP